MAGQFALRVPIADIANQALNSVWDYNLTMRKMPLKVYVDNWRRTRVDVENLRRDDIRTADIADTIRGFDDAFHSAISLKRQARAKSGLVEFQMIIRKTP